MRSVHRFFNKKQQEATMTVSDHFSATSKPVSLYENKETDSHLCYLKFIVVFFKRFLHEHSVLVANTETSKKNQKPII